MSETRYKKLGVIKQTELNKDFDAIYEKYKQMALILGHIKELRFIRERGKVVIYVEI